MGTGYVRQSAADIVAGNTIEATPLNLEFNQLRDAFHETSGHSHDATTGEGPKIALTTSVSGVLPVANGGYAAIHKINGTTAPTVNDDSGDGYGPGSVWVDTTNDKVYVCLDATLTAAVWSLVGTTAGNQPLDATLTALAGVTVAADKVIYATGADAFATTDLTSFARTILDDANQAAVRTTLGLTPGTHVQVYDADLTALAGLTSAADKGIQFTGAGTAATYDLTAFAKTILDDANQAAVRTTLALTPGTDVLAYDAGLSNLAGVTFASDKSVYWTADNVAASYDLSSFARTLLDDTTAAAAATTLGLGTGDTPTFTGVNIGNSDTTVTRSAAGVLAVEGVELASNLPQNSKSAAYTTVLSDANRHIYHPGADTTARIWTIDSNANVPYPVGTAITFINDTSAGVITISITSDTLVLAGSGATGSRTLAANGMATAVKMTSTRWMINGAGLT